jgi:hypothetical protein
MYVFKDKTINFYIGIQVANQGKGAFGELSGQYVHAGRNCRASVPESMKEMAICLFPP